MLNVSTNATAALDVTADGHLSSELSFVQEEAPVTLTFDETDYLLSAAANAAHLRESIAQGAARPSSAIYRSNDRPGVLHPEGAGGLRQPAGTGRRQEAVEA